jgi:hypothetical protein
LLVTFAMLAVTAPELRADEELPNAVPSVMYKRWSGAFALGPALLRAQDRFRFATRAGLGIERRYVSWAFTADVQLAWISADGDSTLSGRFTDLIREGAWSGSFSVAAVYYFGFGAKNVRGRVP